MNKRSKLLSATHFIFALTLLFSSLHFLSSALTYERRQSFASPAISYDSEKNQFLATNLKTQFFVTFTVVFAIGWLCEGITEYFFLRGGRKIGIAIFYIPVVIQVIFFIGMTQIAPGFLGNALLACGFAIMSSFYFRYSMIGAEAFTKLGGELN